MFSCAARTRCVAAAFPTVCLMTSVILNAEILLIVGTIYVMLSRHNFRPYTGRWQQVQWVKKNTLQQWTILTFSIDKSAGGICAKALWVGWPNFLTCQKCIWPFEWRPETDNWPSLCLVNCADNNALQKSSAVWLSYRTKTGSNCSVRAQCQPAFIVILVQSIGFN